MINACIIGVSGFGDVHYKDMLRESENGRLKVMAATIINQDEEKDKCDTLREMGCVIYEDYKKMLADFSGKANVCFIPTGIHLHMPMTVDALEAGMNVFVEKPLAATLQDVNAMKEAEKKSGKFVAVGYQTMYSSDTRIMKETILSGKLGEIKSIKCLGLWPRDEKYYNRNKWAGELKCGDAWVLDSPYNNAIAHQLNMICFLAGEKFEESAKLKSVQAELYRAGDIGSVDTASFRIMTKRNIPLYFIVSHCPEENCQPDIEVVGTKGKMIWRFHEDLTIKFNDGKVEHHKAEDGQACRTSIFDALEKRVDGEDAFVCDLAIAGTQTKVINAAHESSDIVVIPSEYLKTVKAGESHRTVIKGLDAIAHKAFKEEKLFSEAGAPWGEAAEVFPVEEYKEFAGTKEA